MHRQRKPRTMSIHRALVTRLMSEETIEDPAKDSRIKTWLNNVEQSKASGVQNFAISANSEYGSSVGLPVGCTGSEYDSSASVFLSVSRVGKAPEYSSSPAIKMTGVGNNTAMQLETVSAALERYHSGLDSCSARSSVTPDGRGK